MAFPVVHHEPPEARAPGPPSRALWTEMRSAVQLPRLVARARTLRRLRAEERRLAVLVPGWNTSDAVMTPLKGYLRALGHDARSWGLGTNTGNVERFVDELTPRVARWVDEHERPAVMVGWSLGGVISREVARRRPDLVERVVTYGTPVVGGPVHTIASSRWGPEEGQRIAEESDRRERAQPLQVPVTVIFSRRDAVVDWPAQIDRFSPQAEHIEVGSTHVGMGVDPDVWTVVASRL